MIYNPIDQIEEPMLQGIFKNGDFCKNGMLRVWKKEKYGLKNIDMVTSIQLTKSLVKAFLYFSNPYMDILVQLYCSKT